MDMKKAEKEACFKDLYKLDEPDDVSEDILPDSNVAGTKIRFDKSSMIEKFGFVKPSSCISPYPNINIEQKAIQLLGVSSGPTSTNEPQVNIAAKPHTASRCESGYLPASSSTAKAGNVHRDVSMPIKIGKLKKRQTKDSSPTCEPIFSGLTFYFIPNNDIAPPRKLRIKKATERGAKWAKEWQNDITHVILDNGLNYQDVLLHLNLPVVPPNIFLTNELYPADCIKYGMVVNVRQRQYQVQGFQKAALAKPSSLRKENVIQKAPAAGASDSPGRYSRSLDALDHAIHETIQVKDLPLDCVDDDNSNPRSSFNESEEESDKDRPRKSLRRSSSEMRQKSWQGTFSCMQKNTGSRNSENPNAVTIGVLQKMVEYYERVQDHRRTTSYRRAISALRKQSNKITNKEEAMAIPYIGKGLAEKIEEIVWTNRLRKLDNTQFDSRDEALQLFLRIYGVGYSQASRWVELGFRTLKDLTTKAKLTKNQRIGIEHIDDFYARIPRKEVENHGLVVREAIAGEDPNIEVTIGGSYRRGSADSGDIDFIITKQGCPIEVFRSIILGTVMPRLFDCGYLKAGLAVTDRDDGSKWHGAACLSGTSIWRRVDFLLVPYEETGAALIYFIGNDIFNRSIRLLASKKGMRLNQHGLWKDLIRGQKRERITQGNLVEGQSEQKIFEHLGVPWRPPEHRIC
ncbi:MAG: hypothetical protein Q9167_006103 [Letrouitia subvulpina]